jgi:hypothetical protein
MTWKQLLMLMLGMEVHAYVGLRDGLVMLVLVMV